MRFAGQFFEDPIDQAQRNYEMVPSFGVKPAQGGLRFAFPEGTTEKFYQDLNNPIKQPNVEKYIYFRHVLDENNPFPIT